MNKLWKQFIDLFGTAPELAVIGLVTAAGSLVTVLAGATHLLNNGRPVSAAGLLLALGAAVIVCGRDLRRGRWSLASRVVVTLWLLLTLAGCVLVGLWLFGERNVAASP